MQPSLWHRKDSREDKGGIWEADNTQGSVGGQGPGLREQKGWWGAPGDPLRPGRGQGKRHGDVGEEPPGQKEPGTTASCRGHGCSAPGPERRQAWLAQARAGGG